MDSSRCRFLIHAAPDGALHCCHAYPVLAHWAIPPCGTARFAGSMPLTPLSSMGMVGGSQDWDAEIAKRDRESDIMNPDTGQ